MNLRNEIQHLDQQRSLQIVPSRSETLSIIQVQALPVPPMGLALSLPLLYYDCKSKDVPTLVGMGIPLEQIIITNPIDLRCKRWSIGRDINSLTDATMLANLLCPEPPPNVKDEGFFRNSAIRLLKGVIEYFHYNAPGRWDFCDLVSAFESLETLTALLSSDPRTKKYVAGLGTEGTSVNILATVVATIYEYDILAALYDHAQEEFSLREWLHGSPSVLVLGFNHEAKTTLNALDRALFTMATKLILNLSTSRTPRVVVCLDEATQLGRLDGLKDLATLGREKGAVLILGFQSIEDLNHTYGKEVAQTILGMMNHKSILRLAENASATWASSLFGKVVRIKRKFNYQWKTWFFGLMNFGTRSSGGDHEVVEDLVMPAELLSIPPVDFQVNQGLTGYYIGQYRYSHTYPIATLKESLTPPAPMMVEFVPAPAEWQVLRPWDADDYARLNFTPPAGASAPSETAREQWMQRQGSGDSAAPPDAKNGASKGGAIQPEPVSFDFLRRSESPKAAQPRKDKDTKEQGKDKPRSRPKETKREPDRG